MAALSWLPRPRSPIEDSLEARAFVFSGFTVAALAIVLYGQDYVVPGLGVAAAAAGHWVSYRERARRRSFWRQLLLGSLILAALFYVLADSAFAVFGGAMPQANFAILLVAITSFDLKTRRNCYSSLWISLAILYLAAVYAWDYGFGIWLGLWFACLAGFWTASHLRRIGASLAAPPRAAATTILAALALGIGLMAVQPQPGAAALAPLVVSLPDLTGFQGGLESPALPLVQLTAGPAGATSSVDLHYRGRLGDAPVMYVRTGAPAYWRGVVFDTYRGGVWTASNRAYFETDPYLPPKLLPPAPRDHLGTFVQTFRVLRPLPGVINAAYPIASLYAPVAGLREDAYGTFYTPAGLRPGTTYSVVSYLPDLSPAVLRSVEGPGSQAPEGNRAYLDPGQLSAPAQSLADRIVTRQNDEFDTVMAVTTYLQRNYRYTLDLPPVPTGRDPVDWFLFDVKSGYCEQFATAAAVLLRHLGIPTRLATGYATGGYDAVLDQAVVRERDAHAWVEVWFPGHGWVPVDPTPGVDPLAVTRFPNHWAGAGVARLIPHLTVSAPTPALGSAAAAGLLAPAIAIGIAAVLLWTRRRRWAGRAYTPQAGESELLRLYERLQRRLGRRRAPPETPLEYLRSMSSPLLRDVTEAVNQGAYAGRWPSPTEVRKLAERIS